MINVPLSGTSTTPPRADTPLTRRLLNGWPADGALTSLAWAVAIATLYILVPWESMSGRPKFADLDNYLDAIGLVTSVQVLDELSGLAWLFAEPGWTFIQLLIALFAQDPVQALLALSWLCAIAFLWFMHRRAGAALSLIVMFNPLVIDLVFSQVRSAFALALLFLSLGCRNRLMKLALVVYACTVHSVSLILIGCYVVAVALERSSALRTRLLKGIACIGVAVVLAWTLSYGRDALFSAIGDRRAEYDVDSGSVLFVSFWMLWAMAAIAARKVLFCASWHWSDGLVIMLLSTAFFMTLFNTNGLRFVSLTLPLLACNLNLARPALKMGATAFLIAHQAVQFMYWY
jgi:hypothetical protein